MLANSHDLVSWSSQPTTTTSLLVVSSAVGHSTPDLPQLFFPSSPLLVLPFSSPSL